MYMYIQNICICIHVYYTCDILSLKSGIERLAAPLYKSYFFFDVVIKIS